MRFKLCCYNSDNGLLLGIFTSNTNKKVIYEHFKKKLVKLYTDRGLEKDDAEEEVVRMQKKIEHLTLKHGQILHKEYENLFINGE